MSSSARCFNRKSPSRKRGRGGFTLIELLLVISMMAVLAGLVIPQLQPAIHDQLYATAEILISDLEEARALAVANNSRYTIEFDNSDHFYRLYHSGPNSLLDALPASPFTASDDTPDIRTTRLADLPSTGPRVEIYRVYKKGAATAGVTSVEFTPLGGTRRAEATVAWLCCGAGDQRRYLSVEINPVTGLARLGQLTAAAPTGS